MDITDRINKIKTAKRKRDIAAMPIAYGIKKDQQALCEHITTYYADRIDDLIKIANALVQNGFSLGEDECFVSRKNNNIFGYISKNINYYFQGWDIIGIGIKGDASTNGDSDSDAKGDFVVNKYGEIVSYEDYFNIMSWTTEFEEFEKKVFSYVDSL